MSGALRAALVGICLPLACLAQRLTFEAASVKPATPPEGVTVTQTGGMVAPRGAGISIPRNTGGPETDDPTRIHYPLITVKGLLKRAWDSYYAIEAPGWADTQIVAVDATMLPGTTDAQFHEMLRNLIVDRFGLKFHTDSKNVQGYTLVFAKGGPKMKEAAAGYVPPPMAGFRAPRMPTAPGCVLQIETGDRARMVCQAETMERFAGELSRMLRSPVTNATGLTAKYDITVAYADSFGGAHLAPQPPAGDSDPFPYIFDALQSQIGLRLEPKKVPVDIMVVDHIDKTLAAN